MPRHPSSCHNIGEGLNGILANKFNRVCGQKGNSYDAYMDNERWKNKTKPETYVSLPYSRSRVQFKIMNEVGYDDCDYVSLEVHSLGELVRAISKWEFSRGSGRATCAVP